MLRSLARFVVRISFVLYALTVQEASAAEYSSPMWGGSGGTNSYNLDCGNAGVLVGFYGRTGSWIDRIGIICRPVRADGTLGSPYTRGPAGGAGGTGVKVSCGDGQVVALMSASTGSFVDILEFHCYTWSASLRRYQEAWTVAKTFGASGAVGFFGTIQKHAFVKCPGDKIGKALRGKHGSYVDSVRFVCDSYDL